MKFQFLKNNEDYDPITNKMLIIIKMHMDKQYKVDTMRYSMSTKSDDKSSSTYPCDRNAHSITRENPSV